MNPEHSSKGKDFTTVDDIKHIYSEQLEDKRWLRDIKKHFISLIPKMYENIKNTDYGLLIGDDTSGRIPTLVFRKLLNKVYQEKGKDNPKTFFIAPNRIDPEEDLDPILDSDSIEKIDLINEFTKKIINENKDILKKVLLVTDTVESGGSLLPVTRVLRDAGVKFDIATLGVLGHQGEIEEILKPDNFYYGNEELPAVYKRKDLSGIDKNANKLHSFPIVPENNGLYKEYLKMSIKTVRQDIDKLVEELFAYYKEKESEIENNANKKTDSE